MLRVRGSGVLGLLLFFLPAAGLAQDLRVSGDRLFIPAEINGHKVEALLDSGAEMTLVDAGKASEIGLEAAGSAEARGTGKGTQSVKFARVAEIRAAGVVLRNRTVAVLDLSDVAKRLVGEPVSAILGRDLFEAGRFHLNIGERQFKPVSKEAQPEGVRLALTDSRGIKQVPIQIEGRKALADFDLGNGTEMLIGQKYAESIGLLTDDRKVGTRQGGGIGGALERRIVHVKQVKIAGIVFRDIEAAIDASPTASDANVGVALLRRFEMTIDFSGNAVWLKPIHHLH